MLPSGELGGSDLCEALVTGPSFSLGASFVISGLDPSWRSVQDAERVACSTYSSQKTRTKIVPGYYRTLCLAGRVSPLRD